MFTYNIDAEHFYFNMLMVTVGSHVSYDGWQVEPAMDQVVCIGAGTGIVTGFDEQGIHVLPDSDEHRREVHSFFGEDADDQFQAQQITFFNDPDESDSNLERLDLVWRAEPIE